MFFVFEWVIDVINWVIDGMTCGVFFLLNQIVFHEMNFVTQRINKVYYVYFLKKFSKYWQSRNWSVIFK